MEDYREMILSGLQEIYPAYEFQVISVAKNNGCSYDGIQMVLPDIHKCVPIIPCRYYEEQLERGEATLDDVLRQIQQLLEECTEINALNFRVFDLIRKDIFLRVINYSKNENRLENVPYQRFLDLAVVCKIQVKVSDTEQASTLITDSLLSLWNITQQECMEIAYENTFGEKMVQINSMNNVLRKIMQMEEDFLHGMKMPEDDTRMYVANMGEVCGGSVCILKKEAFREFAMKMRKDLYLLPSSLHELIVVPKNTGVSEALLMQTVKEVNRDMVSEEEVLSNHVYFYDRVKDEILDLGEADE